MKSGRRICGARFLVLKSRDRSQETKIFAIKTLLIVRVLRRLRRQN